MNEQYLAIGRVARRAVVLLAATAVVRMTKARQEERAPGSWRV